MKYLLYAAILTAVLLWPVEGTDVGKLIPVEIIAVSESGGTVTISADTGDMGKGADIDSAIENMKASAAGIIYLDTAEYLLIEKGMEDSLVQLDMHLKGSARVCNAKEGIPLEGMADYLSVHRPDSRLDHIGNVDQIPEITENEGRYQIVE